MTGTKLLSQLEELAKLQDQLNLSIDKEWKKNRTLQDWVRTTWTECAELMQSLPWCWWKGIKAPDNNNVAVELVDILHMVLSYIILAEHQGKENLLPYFSKQFEKDEGQNAEDKAQRLVILIEKVARYFLNEQPKEGLHYFALAIKETVGFEKVYKLYIGKNILNHLRQEFGYKIGKYQKIIEGREDNAFLVDYINEGLGLKDIKVKLEELLSKHNKRVSQKISS